MNWCYDILASFSYLTPLCTLIVCRFGLPNLRRQPNRGVPSQLNLPHTTQLRYNLDPTLNCSTQRVLPRDLNDRHSDIVHAISLKFFMSFRLSNTLANGTVWAHTLHRQPLPVRSNLPHALYRRYFECLHRVLYPVTAKAVPVHIKSFAYQCSRSRMGLSLFFMFCVLPPGGSLFTAAPSSNVSLGVVSGKGFTVSWLTMLYVGVLKAVRLTFLSKDASSLLNRK